jgi:hypothetical protein
MPLLQSRRVALHTASAAQLCVPVRRLQVAPPSFAAWPLFMTRKSQQPKQPAKPSPAELKRQEREQKLKADPLYKYAKLAVGNTVPSAADNSSTPKASKDGVTALKQYAALGKQQSRSLAVLAKGKPLPIRKKQARKPNVEALRAYAQLQK